MLMAFAPMLTFLIGVALIGYYLAAAVVDHRYIGRLRLQLLGFAFVGALFYVSAIWYHPLTKPGGVHVFQFVSFSFANKCLSKYAVQNLR